MTPESPAVTVPTKRIPDRKVPAPKKKASIAPPNAPFEISAISNKSADKGAHGTAPRVNPIKKIPPGPYLKPEAGPQAHFFRLRSSMDKPSMMLTAPPANLKAGVMEGPVTLLSISAENPAANPRTTYAKSLPVRKMAASNRLLAGPRRLPAEYAKTTGAHVKRQGPANPKLKPMPKICR